RPGSLPARHYQYAPRLSTRPLCLPMLSARPTTIVALRATQTTNQGFVSFAASPNNTLERVTVAAAIRPATSGLIALPSVPPAEQVRLPRSMSGRSSTGVHRLTGCGRVAFKPVTGSRRKHRQWSRHQPHSLHSPAGSQRHCEGLPQHPHSRALSDPGAPSCFVTCATGEAIIRPALLPSVRGRPHVHR